MAHEPPELRLYVSISLGARYSHVNKFWPKGMSGEVVSEASRKCPKKKECVPTFLTLPLVGRNMGVLAGVEAAILDKEYRPATS